MKTYYAITSRVRYYKVPATVELFYPWLRETIEVTSGETPFDFSRWKDAPHLALANLRDEPEAVLRFTRTYGLVAQYYRGKPRRVLVQHVLRLRDLLRRAWEGDAEPFFAMALGQTHLYFQPAGMELAVRDPWTLIQVMFALDWAEKRVKKCANPDCVAPYFLAVRKSQKFCSQKCAVLITVRHFRAREAARKSKRGEHAKAKKA